MDDREILDATFRCTFLAGHCGAVRYQGLQPGLLQLQVQGLGAEVDAGADFGVQVLEQGSGHLDGLPAAADGELKGAGDLRQRRLLVKLAAKCGEVAGIAGFQQKTDLARLTGRFVAIQIGRSAAVGGPFKG